MGTAIFSSLGLFSGEKMGKAEENEVDFKPPFFEAASSATRDESTEVSIWAEDVEEESLAAIAATAAFLLSSSEVLRDVKGIAGWERGGGVALLVG